MMKKFFALLALLILSGCNDEPPLIPGLTKSSVAIRTDPASAEVFFNNSSTSVPTPAYFNELEPGFFRIHFRAAKFRDTSFYLFLKRNVKDSVFVQITEDPQYWWKYYSNTNSPLPTLAITKVVLDKDNLPVLLTGNKGIVKFDGAGFMYLDVTNSGLPDNTVNDLSIDPSGVYWIATNRGLARYDGINWIVYNSSNTNIPENKLTSVCVDKNRIVWIGTYSSGLLKFDGVSFITYSIFNSELPSNNVTCIAADASNKKWIGTRNEGIASFDGIDWKVFNRLKHGLLSDVVSAVAFDKYGTPWVGCGSFSSPGGVCVLQGEKATNYSKSNSRLPGSSVTSLAFDSGNTLWVATEDGGMAKFDGTMWRVYNSYSSGLKQNTVASLCIDNSNTKYIAANGFYIYTGQK